MSFMIDDIDYIQQVYRELKAEVDEVEMEFENTVRVYRSPLRQALNDITRLYNSVNNVKGDFSGFKNVSVYVHGIESNGEDFIKSAKKAAQPGDVIMREMRKGKNEYFVVNEDGGIKEFKEFEKLRLADEFKNKQGRLHIVYDTEHKNEHRQETSDDVAKRLTEMGLVNETTKIDLFAHSYGGRRFFQFAMDYPDQVRSITTIGTPYDKNTMGKLGNNVSILRWKWVQKLVDKEPTQYSGYVDPNPENRRVDKGIEHSNVYTDMTSEALSEEMTYLKAANPEVYRKLEEMDITAVAGYDLAGWLGTKSSQDGAVSVKSQQAKSLGALIDQRLSYKVDGGAVSPHEAASYL